MTINGYCVCGGVRSSERSEVGMLYLSLAAVPSGSNTSIGACDNFWGYGPVPKFGLSGGGCNRETSGGASCLCLDYTHEHVHWVVGACDYFWGRLSDLRYTVCGGRCSNSVYVGWVCLDLLNTSEYGRWQFGACIVM